MSFLKYAKIESNDLERQTQTIQEQSDALVKKFARIVRNVHG